MDRSPRIAFESILALGPSFGKRGAIFLHEF